MILRNKEQIIINKIKSINCHFIEFNWKTLQYSIVYENLEYFLDSIINKYWKRKKFYDLNVNISETDSLIFSLKKFKVFIKFTLIPEVFYIQFFLLIFIWK